MNKTFFRCIAAKSRMIDRFFDTLTWSLIGSMALGKLGKMRNVRWARGISGGVGVKLTTFYPMKIKENVQEGNKLRCHHFGQDVSIFSFLNPNSSKCPSITNYSLEPWRCGRTWWPNHLFAITSSSRHGEGLFGLGHVHMNKITWLRQGGEMDQIKSLLYDFKFPKPKRKDRLSLAHWHITMIRGQDVSKCGDGMDPEVGVNKGWVGSLVGIGWMDVVSMSSIWNVSTDKWQITCHFWLDRLIGFTGQWTKSNLLKRK